MGGLNRVAKNIDALRISSRKILSQAKTELVAVENLPFDKTSYSMVPERETEQLWECLDCNDTSFGLKFLNACRACFSEKCALKSVAYVVDAPSKLTLLQHYQYFAMVVVMCMASFLLYPSRKRMESPSIFYGMMHLGSFGANFGAQLWVTFIAGLTMFYSLPRHMFGKVQSRLFPMFFLWSLVCSAITLSTFLIQHPHDTWDSTHYIQVISLSVCFLAAALNSIVVSPLIVSAMMKTFTMEVDAGVGNVVGYADMKDLKKNSKYFNNYKMFRRCHGASAMLVVSSLLSNIVFLYFLTHLSVQRSLPV